MKRVLVLWLVLGLVGLAVTVLMVAGVTRSFDLRFEPFLTAILAPAVNAALLLWLVPELRDRRAGSLASALRPRRISNPAGVLIVLLATLATLLVFGIAPKGVFALLRGLLALAAACGFAFAGFRGRRGSLPVAALLAVLGGTSGQLHRLAEWVFATQPLAFRWLVFYGVAAIVVVGVVFHAVERLRDAAPPAATLLEAALAPAALASVIVVGGVFWRPYLTPVWWLLANTLGLIAMALTFLASVAAMSRT